MGKTSEAAVYRKYINAMKKKTKRMNEAANPAQQAAIAIDMKKKGKKPKSMKEETMTPAQKRKDTMLKKKYDKSDMKKSMQKQYGKEEGKKVYFATIRKQAMNKEEYIDEGIGKFFKRITSNLKTKRYQNMKTDPRLKDIENDPDLKKIAQDNVRNLPSNPTRKYGMGIVKNETGVTGGNVIKAKDRFKKKIDDDYKYDVS